ncbi:uncharacterized protein [Cherax quadricarinatus]|uniref:uncharacterized protein n=1 Tax=Cherax quadricarinatus TaxID=27406 RepID=UPI00387E75A9
MASTHSTNKVNILPSRIHECLTSKDHQKILSKVIKWKPKSGMTHVTGSKVSPPKWCHPGRPALPLRRHWQSVSVVDGGLVQDVPARYTVRGVQAHKRPVFGNCVDPAITPGFCYQVRHVDSTKLLFKGRNLRLLSVGMGYGKRITFASDSHNINNYFWSDTHPEGYGFTLCLVQQGDKFTLRDANNLQGDKFTLRDANNLQGDKFTLRDANNLQGEKFTLRDANNLQGDKFTLRDVNNLQDDKFTLRDANNLQGDKFTLRDANNLQGNKFTLRDANNLQGDKFTLRDANNLQGDKFTLRDANNLQGDKFTLRDANNLQGDKFTLRDANNLQG